MDINSNIEQMVEYINLELKKGRSMKEIEQQDFGVNERVITKRLNRRGYKKVDGIFKKNDTTSNITNSIEGKIETYNLSKKPKNEEIIRVKHNKNIDMDKLQKLLDNLDSLLELVDRQQNTTCNITSNETVVTSLRINKEVYEMVKQRARDNNIKVGEIVNRALLDYLKNYI